MHHLSLIYFFTHLLHVSGMFIAHHQEVFTVYVQQLIRVIRLTSSWSGQERTVPSWPGQLLVNLNVANQQSNSQLHISADSKVYQNIHTCIKNTMIIKQYNNEQITNPCIKSISIKTITQNLVLSLHSQLRFRL
jgi:hypothetical protein